MAISEQRKGELFSLAETLLWGLFPVITILTYTSIPALISLGWSTMFAALLFAAFVTVRKKWDELKRPMVLRYTLLATFFIGILLYSLYFTALRFTTAGNAALIMLLTVFTSFLYFNVFRKETMPTSHVLGAVCMVIGGGLVLGPNASSPNLGDLLCVLAICVAPFGNYFSQRAVKLASSETVMCVRSAISVPFIFLLALVTDTHASWQQIQESLPFLLINGFLLLGVSKLFFLEAIKRISVTKALSLESGAVIVTLIAAWLFLNQPPTTWQLLALVPLLVGVALLTDQLKLERRAA